MPVQTTELCLVTPQGNMIFAVIETLQAIQKVIGGQIIEVPKHKSPQ